MSNLALAIPYPKWKAVLSEVNRVLLIGGRLELIDDQLFFPYDTEPVPSSPTSSIQTAVTSIFDDDNDEIDTDDDADATLGADAVSLSASIFESVTTEADSDDCSSSSSSSHKKFKSEAVTPTQVSIPSPGVVTPPPPAVNNATPSAPASPIPSSLPPLTPWRNQASASRDLEVLYERMLLQKFEVHPRPSEFVLDVMKQVFGKPNAGKMTSLHLKLAPTAISSAGSSRSGESDRESLPGGATLKHKKSTWMTVEWDKKEKKPKELKEKAVPGAQRDSTEGRSSNESLRGPCTQVPEGISAKAAGRLGINYSTLTAASASVLANRPSTSSSIASSNSVSSRQSIEQPPGLILWPSTHIPMSRAELEMHASRHMHTLLGCKPALSEYIAGFLDEEGNRLVTAQDFEETIWDYEL